jgi:tetratricopeptide (TPR) repeat protein
MVSPMSERRALENPSAIRRALGKGIVDKIDSLSLHQAKRRGTVGEKLRLLRTYNNPYCASCGRPAVGLADGATPVELQAAHILALSEGGDTTDKNLVLLCANSGHRRDECDACTRKEWCGDRGCHTLFDEGYASVSEVRVLADRWRRGMSGGFRETLLERSREHYSQSAPLSTPGAFGDLHKLLFQKAHWNEVIRGLREARKGGLSELDYAQSYLEEASVERRRGRQSSLDRSLKILARFENERLPAEKIASYLYELGYVQQLRGLHAQSLQTYERGLELAEADLGPDSFAAVSARNRVMAVRTIMLNPQTVTPRGAVRTFREFDAQLKRAEQLQPKVRSGNWMFNILGWRTRFAIKCSRIADAQESLRQLRELRDSQHAATGYTRMTATTMLGFEAMVLAMERPTERGVREQVQRAATAVRAGLHGNHRPEGIRDNLLTLEGGWKRLMVSDTSYQERAEAVREVRERIVDGTSFLDPYRAVV